MELESIDDKELVALLKSGDKRAYQLLFEKYASKIYHFSLSYLANEADSEELVQDVFLKLWEKRAALDETQNIKAYVFKIAINSIYDFIRRKNIKNAFNDFVKNRAETNTSNNTWETVVLNELQLLLDELISKMPEQRRNIFHLSKINGLTNDEIAEKLNLSKRTVENQLYRAILFLKSNLKNQSLTLLLFFYLFYS